MDRLTVDDDDRTPFDAGSLFDQKPGLIPDLAGQPKAPLLLRPIALRGIVARNRIMISPMCMYSAKYGKVNDFHLVHLGRYALGGAGIVMAEATAVEPRGRISVADAGLWADDQVEPWRRITGFLTAHGAIPGVQLAHAGRKASTLPPWEGGAPLPRDGAGWQPVAPSEIDSPTDGQMPTELNPAEITKLVSAWADAARRAHRAGFRLIEVHGAHGYLLHSFLSPISNRRTDAYGGDLARRMRFPLEVATAIRAVWPVELPLAWRVSALDGIDGGWTMEDTLVFSAELAERGVDVIDTSSGGITSSQAAYDNVRRGYAFHTPYSAQIRSKTGMCTAVVGLIVDPIQANDILERGDADIIVIGREALADPQWALNAGAMLAGDGFEAWPVQAGHWLNLRASTLQRLKQAGETPRRANHSVPIGATGRRGDP